ncbi:MAG: dienelactone hydrolase family protein [Proteobacteria bacterium]|nr:dienelactone hydrolase family protein [Pseudomonadota bacterium]
MGEKIRLTASDGHEFGAYRAEAQGTPKGAVVLIQEIFGVNQHIRALVDEYAGNGYTTIAPQLYDRTAPDIELGYDEEGRQAGMKGREGITPEMWSADLAAARASVASAGKIGIVGYCYGGTVSWFGAQDGGFDAAVCYYGGGIADMLDKPAKCPVMMHFGAEDQGIPMEKVDAIKAADTGADIHVYDGAGHGFVCDERPSFSEEATNTSRSRTLDFFGKHLS